MLKIIHNQGSFRKLYIYLNIREDAQLPIRIPSTNKSLGVDGGIFDFTINTLYY